MLTYSIERFVLTVCVIMVVLFGGLLFSLINLHHLYQVIATLQETLAQ